VQLRDRGISSLRAERAPQLLALSRREACQVARYLQHLLLEQDDAKSLRERVFQQGMLIGDGLQALASA
jgi:hypothetical protein